MRIPDALHEVQSLIADAMPFVRTHLLLGDSPAIDRGQHLYNRQYDQRGAGYPRVKGIAPDIGAIEY